jgi:hypothetical protein
MLGELSVHAHCMQISAAQLQEKKQWQQFISTSAFAAVTLGGFAG